MDISPCTCNLSCKCLCVFWIRNGIVERVWCPCWWTKRLVWVGSVVKKLSSLVRAHQVIGHVTLAVERSGWRWHWYDPSYDWRTAPTVMNPYTQVTHTRAHTRARIRTRIHTFYHYLCLCYLTIVYSTSYYKLCYTINVTLKRGVQVAVSRNLNFCAFTLWPLLSPSDRASNKCLTNTPSS